MRAKMTAAQKKAFLKRMSAGRVKASTGRAKSAGALRSYVVEDERTERVLGTYRAASPSAAITACMRRHPGHSRANLSAHVMPSKAGRVTGRKITRNAGAAGMVAKAGAGSTAGYYEIVDRLGRNDLVGRGNKFSSRKSAATALASLRRDKSEDYTNFKIRHVRSAGGMVKRRAGSAAMPARKGRQSGAMGSGTPVARLQRVESAVMDLARANHAVVSKVVEHERRLNTMETTLSNWAKGRR